MPLFFFIGASSSTVQAINGILLASTLTFPGGTIANAPVQAITGTTLSSTLTFPAGSIANAPVQAITGTLLGSSLTFPAGMIAPGTPVTQAITGNLLGSTLTFGTGTLSLGAGPLQTITGTLLSSSLSFPSGTVANAPIQTIAGSVLSSTLTFPPGVLAAGTGFLAITGTLLPSTLTFPTGNMLLSGTLTTLALTDYLFVWNLPYEDVIVGETIPVRFTLTRADGQVITLMSGDAATLTVLDPTGVPATFSAIDLSAVGPSVSIDYALNYNYSLSGLYTLTMTITHDGQVISARKRIPANV